MNRVDTQDQNIALAIRSCEACRTKCNEAIKCDELNVSWWTDCFFFFRIAAFDDRRFSLIVSMLEKKENGEDKKKMKGNRRISVGNVAHFFRTAGRRFL